MVCADDYFTVDFLQSFESESLINALRKTLDGVGIEYITSERIQTETFRDKAFLTASSQAERYHKVLDQARRRHFRPQARNFS